MLSRKLKTAVLAVLAAGTLAGPAQAAMIDGDGFKITSPGYDFGAWYWAYGEPDGVGALYWYHENGGLRPELVGTLHLKDVDGTCGRMRMQYFDRAGTWIHSEFSDTECVTDNDHHRWPVHVDGENSDEVKQVKVSLQKQTVAGWETIDSMTFDADTHDDDVKITEDGVDFGGEGWGVGAPSGNGELSWGLVDGVVTPRLTGAIHLNNSSGVCARMNLRYLTEGGAFLNERAGGVVCAADNDHDAWTVDLAPWSSDKIGKVRVQLQTLAANGNWINAGGQVVELAE